MGNALTDDEAFLPNEHLRVSGIPPIPRSLAERVGRYAAFGPTDIVDWHPARRALLVAARHGATMQLHLLEAPMGALDPLTAFPDPVVQATFEPVRGDYLVYLRDAGGDEAAQIHRYDFATRASTLLTDPLRKHGVGVWNHAGTAIAFGSLPLDRAGAATLGDMATDLCTLDPLVPTSTRRIAVLPGGGWQDFRWSPDDRTIYAMNRRAINDCSLWSIDVASGERTRLVSSDARSISIEGLELTGDGTKLVYASDEDGEFRQLMTLTVATGDRRNLTRDIPWDVVSIALRPGDASSLACIVVNVAGRHELRLVDLENGLSPLPALPDVAQSGSVSHVRFARCGDADEIAFNVNSARSPNDVYTIGVRSGEPAVRWTRIDVDGIDTATYREADIVRWTSFDGREISGLISRPPARFGGKRPVLVHIHGGPESQATIGFLGVNNYFVNELGIAYLQPNVRGSTGYGRTFVSLDDGMKREDSVRDIGALLDWIASQPDLDASRVLVAGRSYGGFMSLAVATNYASRIVASIAIVGISHFTTFLERTETYRRDLRRVEYGDERDPAMRAFFDRISPLANADRIAKPLFVVAGRNDPRVPYQEGEQIVATVRSRGVPVWHLVADDEGHVFAKKPNTDFVFYAQVAFVQRYLLA